MTNLIYNKFAKAFVDSKINLELEKTYKIALLNSKYIPTVEDSSNFEILKNAGFQSIDFNDNYKDGGKYIIFTKLGSSNPYDGVIKYSAGVTRWDNTYIDNATYAIIYRESDGLLLSCHAFGKTISTKNENIVLDWENIPTIVINTHSEDPSFETDDNLRTDSQQPVQNRIITNAINQLGTVFIDDEDDIPHVINFLKTTDTKVDDTKEYYEYDEESDSYNKVTPKPGDNPKEMGWYEDRYEDWKENLTYVATIKNVDEIFDEVVENV